MLRLVGLMISIGLADSLNPSTIAPALYLAAGDHPRRRVTEFTLAVFVVYLGGGTLLALGPGQLIRSLVPHPHRTPRHIAEIVAGCVLIITAMIIWHRRQRLASRRLPQAQKAKSSALLGATITLIELPTAFPYFAAIAAVLGAGLDVGQEFLLLVIFNVCFVLPLLVIVFIVTFAGDRSTRVLGVGRRFLERRWPQILAGLFLIVGVGAVLVGASGLAAAGHGGIGRFFRHVRRFFHLRAR